jgi:hypothetical protein
MAVLATFSVIIICSILIWRKMRQNTMPEQQRSVRISRQVGRVLLIQAIIPLVLQTLPTLFLIQSIIFGHDISFLSSFIFSQTWTTGIYTMATMAIIGHYRREIKKIFVKNSTTVYPSTE